ncbi:hypothetical protein NKI59_25080 [Mesorhizobium sp. M0598]|uniref:hypothetical protein n=1 Tax=Mesorhizobium sp. M0598 TaxID=2956968 RepID=UPI003339F56B
MLELNTAKFFDTIQEVQRVRTFIETVFDDAGKTTEVTTARDNLRSSFEELTAATTFIGAEVAAMAASRMAARLADANEKIMMDEIGRCISDVQSRLRDECQLLSFMILNRNQKTLFQPANKLVDDWDINRIFPDAARELEEACKCLALQRPTAAVFHAMRMLEVGIRKLADLLDLPDQTKPGERNWGTMLKTIKSQIEEKYPARMPNSEGASFERMFASLDAVKNPWRNGTMHVESFYTDSEALHIVRCVAYFMQTLGVHCAPNEVSMPEPDGGLAE